jgi:hypothetical protein
MSRAMRSKWWDFTHHLARDVELFAYALDVFPILLPLTAHICARFVPGVPVPHKDGAEIIILGPYVGKRAKDSGQDIPSRRAI